MGNVPIEPSAEMRMFAHTTREMYLALLAEGFTEREAFNIVGVTIAASFGQGSAE